MTEQMKDLIRFRRERDVALLTGDIFEVRKFAQRWYKHLPATNSLHIEIAAMHIAIVNTTTLPPAYRLRSRQWLSANGFDPKPKPKQQAAHV